MGSESRPVSGFPCENLGAVLVSSLPFGGFYDRDDSRVVDFERSGEMLGHMGGPRHDPRTEHVVEDAVPSAQVCIAESLHEAGAANSERSRPVDDQPPDRVLVLTVSRLNRKSSRGLMLNSALSC